MEAPQSVQETPVRNNRTVWIIAAAVIGLCCCGVIVAAAGFYGFFTIRSVATGVPPDEFPTPPFDLETPFTTPETNTDPGEAPTGGLGNDILRHDTWQYVAAAAVGQGCDQPIGPNSTIDVLQQPDAGGGWVEKWTVVCRSGDSFAYQVTYTTDSSGATFDIKSLP
jgi:hypothetical protein